MVNINKGKVEYQGTQVELLSEMTMCLKALYDDGVINDGDLEFMVQLVKTPREKLKEEAMLKMLSSMVSMFGEDAVREIVKGGKDQ